ncbi:MAG: aminotransferase [Pseudomonadota bacterium]
MDHSTDRHGRNLDTDTLQRLDNRVVHPWENFGGIGEHKRLVIERGEGVHVIDSDGNRMLDGPAGMWCVNVGYGRQEIANAIADQAMQLGYYSPFSNATSSVGLLTEKLGEYAPGDLTNIYFTCGGSTAVDGALRFVQFYNNALGRSEKKKIIARVGGYHGSTFLSASVSGKLSDKTNLDMADNVILIPAPKPLLRPDGMSLEAFCDEKVADLENAILDAGPETVAVHIAEPILASGGVIIPPEGYQKRCLEICRKYDVLYISDEVVTGFGRLGEMFASERLFGIVPDMITMAKGLTSGYQPMGGLMISQRLIDDIKASGTDYKWFSNGFTYSGHPVGAAAALANIDIFEREDLLQQVRDVSPYFAERLKDLADLPVVSEVRAIGLMAGVECQLDAENPDEERDMAFAAEVDKHCMKNGLLVRPIYNMCVMSPPLTITREQIDFLADTLKAGLLATMESRGISA